MFYYQIFVSKRFILSNAFQIHKVESLTASTLNYAILRVELHGQEKKTYHR